ncbi:conjugal transfer protein [Glutamicibacter sp. BW80]|uniref:type IV secretory system conjugative DNA transfer family protein n=1 Tax=Glutamicibacter sp. BW80 TaxID=2024404 RepID=UPI000BB8ABFD|nr:type IV secretory system conjugative DNA transfer family protein [Glutamicibacter sp. BW80]PCC27061.1 conjugal transfer protein [Glutamicibacter sp. BW80]
MSTPNNRRQDPGGFSGEVLLLSVLVGVVIALLFIVNISVRLGHKFSGSEGTLTSDPFELVFTTFQGKVEWPTTATFIAIALCVVLLAIVVLILLMARKFRKNSTRVDRAAQYMGRGRDIESLTTKKAQESADRFGVESPGLPIGSTLTGVSLYSSWEDMRISIAGPRMGKSTCQVIPQIIAAPGAVLNTSNKRDTTDATRDIRAKFGKVWVFDPQGIANEEPTWWWNPLSYVSDEVTAAKLAEHFASGSRDPNAKTDAYFDPAGQDLLAGLLLAAALDQRPITDVYTWITRPKDETAVFILQDHQFNMIADQVMGVIQAPDKQRGGIYGTAQQMASCLTIRRVASWVNPQSMADARPQFSPHEFVRGKNTLYSLSKEGRGTAGPLVTALTVAVAEAAEELATSKGGRLSVPLVGILDEAANVCRWRELPNLYSHYGSRGIIFDTVLQSWSQGVGVWGESGMKMLWSAANVKFYGGNVSEKAFLDDMAAFIGDFDRVTSSVSSGRGQRSVSRQLHRERILGVDDLAALPKGRGVVFSAGNRPVLIRTKPWMTGPMAEDIKASITAHDPQSKETLDNAQEGILEVARLEESSAK